MPDYDQKDFDPQAAMAALQKREGDQAQLLEQFVTGITPLVSNYIHKRVTDRHLAEDIVQEALLKVTRRWPKYTPERGDVEAWLVNITQTTIATMLTKPEQRTARHANTGAGMLDRLVAAKPDKTDMAEDMERLEAALEQLEERFAPHTIAAFRGTAMEGRSAEEVATKLGMKKATVYVSRSKVTKALQEMLVNPDQDRDR